MTETYSPFDSTTDSPGIPMFEADWSKLWAGSYSNGVIHEEAGLAVYTDQDGRQVKVSPGGANIRGHKYSLDVIKVVPIDANTSGSNRIDRVVLRLDTLAKTMSVVAKTGTPGAANPPALTQVVGGVWETSLAIITVPSGFTTLLSGAVVDARDYAEPNNHYISADGTTHRFGSGVRGSSSYITLGDLGFAGNAYVLASNSGGPDANLILEPQGAGTVTIQGPGGGGTWLYADGNSVASPQTGKFGAGALGTSGNFVSLGTLGAPTTVYVQAYGTSQSIDLTLDAKGAASVVLENNSGVHQARLDPNGTWVVGNVAPSSQAAALSAAVGDIGMSNGTLRFAGSAVVSGSATAGGTTLPGQAAGYITVKIDGNPVKIPYYNN